MSPARRGLLALPIALALAAPEARAYPNGPPPGASRAPGDGTCADVGCHVAVADDPAGQITLQLLDDATGLPFSSYVPGTTYLLEVRLRSGRTDRRRWGFEMLPLDGSAVQAGSFPATADPDYLSIDDFIRSRQYVGHTEVGSALGDTDGQEWRVRWLAPSSDVGPITFYACANAANGDGIPVGDYIGCTTFTVLPPPPPITLWFDTSITALAGGSSACGLATQPPVASRVTTPCDTPPRSCNPALVLALPDGSLAIVPNAGGPDRVLAGEAAPGSATALALYELDTCTRVLRLRRDGLDLWVDAE